MLTYSKNDIRQQVGLVIMTAMRLYNAYSYRNELTKIATDICDNALSGGRQLYSQKEVEAIVEDVNCDVYDFLD